VSVSGLVLFVVPKSLLDWSFYQSTYRLAFYESKKWLGVGGGVVRSCVMLLVIIRFCGFVGRSGAFRRIPNAE
jgi:hypothetical protein